jgi:hypothetical protein
MFSCEPPTHLDRGGEVRFEVLQRKADIPDELGFAW